MRGTTAVLIACQIAAAGGCGKIERKTDAERARALVADVIRRGDVGTLKAALSRDTALRIEQLAPEEREEFLAGLLRSLKGYVVVENGVGGSRAEGRFTVRLHKADDYAICLPVAVNRQGELGLDLSESIDGFAELVVWSRKQSEDYARRFAKNAGDPPLVIGGIEIAREIEPRVFRVGVGVPLSLCEEAKSSVVVPSEQP